MSVTELDNFIQKFHQLWKAGHIAHLDVDTCAGKAWVGLRVQLGHAPGPPHHQLRPPPFSHVHRRKDTPSRQRRRARRTAARKVNIAEEAANIGVNESAEEPDSSKTDDVIENTRKEAENATTEEVDAAETGNNLLIAEKAVSDYLCDICEKTFVTLKGLRSHTGQVHKATYSPIPQIDGNSDKIDETTFCRICKDWHEETKTSEDLSYHIMNNHETSHVFEAYGHEWVEQRKSCIRRGSPFYALFPHR